MRVPRKVNVAWQTFNAWQHRINIDPLAKPTSVQDAFTAQWEQSDHDFTPHKVTVSSGSFASRATANQENEGVL